MFELTLNSTAFFQTYSVTSKGWGEGEEVESQSHILLKSKNEIKSF